MHINGEAIRSDWFVLRNNRAAPLIVQFEPMGLAYDVPTNASLLIFARERRPHVHEIDVDDAHITIHAGEIAVFSQKKLLINGTTLSDEELIAAKGAVPVNLEDVQIKDAVNSVNFEYAIGEALRHVNNINRNKDDSIIIVKHQILNNNGGWLFFYDSKKYVETKSISYALAGNGPIIITKSGEIVQLGGLDWEEDLENYLLSLES